MTLASKDFTTKLSYAARCSAASDSIKHAAPARRGNQKPRVCLSVCDHHRRCTTVEETTAKWKKKQTIQSSPMNGLWRKKCGRYRRSCVRRMGPLGWPAETRRRLLNDRPSRSVPHVGAFAVDRNPHLATLPPQAEVVAQAKSKQSNHRSSRTGPVVLVAVGAFMAFILRHRTRLQLGVHLGLVPWSVVIYGARNSILVSPLADFSS